jgi:hypothetical protein
MLLSHSLVTSSYTVAQIQSELTQLRAGGVTWVREDLPWAVAEPEPGVFNWAPFDRLLQAASRARVHVLGILDYSAPWASSDPSGAGDVFYPPKNDSDFATYAAAVAARYGSLGSFWALNPQLARDPLAAVEIWNEPYGSWYWKPGPDPAAYDQLVRRTAPALHAVDPALTVLMSGDLQSWDERHAQHVGRWLPQLLAIDPGISKLVNGLDVHPYPTPRNLSPTATGPDVRQSFQRVPLIHQAEMAAGVNLPIWLTEFGWSTAPRTASAVSYGTQATYVTDALHLALESWGSYVSHVFIDGWSRSNGVAGDWAHNLGVLNPAGVPLPVWGSITGLLGGQAAEEPCPDCPS